MIEPRYALASLVSVAVWLSPGNGETSLLVGVFATPPATVCVEDMPCWNWRTMGNRCRGLDNGLVECVTRTDGTGNAYSELFTDYETETGEYVAGYN